MNPRHQDLTLLRPRSTARAALALLIGITAALATHAADDPYPVTAPSAEHVAYYDLDTAFYKKSIHVQDILIATSDNVSDYALKESAYLFDKMMASINPDVAQRVREQKPLCILIGATEQVSEIPQFKTDKTGEELDYYNWRKRGFLTSLRIDGRSQPTVVFAEEDVLEYPGGMLDESILVHEFGHVVMFQGFNEAQMERVTRAYENAKKAGLYNDGYAAQRFGRVQGDKPVKHLGVDEKAFRKGHSCLTVVCDLEAGTVEHVAEDRRSASLGEYFRGLTDAQLAGIEAVAMGMWQPYVKATMEHVPLASENLRFG